MDLESVTLEAKLKSVDIYKESLVAINAFLDRKGYDEYPHLSPEVIDAITDDMMEAYRTVCESDSRSLVSALKEMIAIIDLHTPAFTIIRRFVKT